MPSPIRGHRVIDANGLPFIEPLRDPQDLLPSKTRLRKKRKTEKKQKKKRRENPKRRIRKRTALPPPRHRKGRRGRRVVVGMMDGRE